MAGGVSCSNTKLAPELLVSSPTPFLPLCCAGSGRELTCPTGFGDPESFDNKGCRAWQSLNAHLSFLPPRLCHSPQQCGCQAGCSLACIHYCVSAATQAGRQAGRACSLFPESERRRQALENSPLWREQAGNGRLEAAAAEAGEAPARRRPQQRKGRVCVFCIQEASRRGKPRE